MNASDARSARARAPEIPGFAFVALGSNLGDSTALIRAAARRLDDFATAPPLKSSLWESAPVDCPPGSPWFVNAVVGFRPAAGQTPESLLAGLQQIEAEFGRRAKQVINEPRPLDLDLIAFGSEIRTSPELTLPHPRAGLRRFVLQPLDEIAPDLVLPGWDKSVHEALASLPSAEGLRRLGSFE